MGSWMYNPYDLTLRQSGRHPGGVTGWNAIQSRFRNWVIEVKLLVKFGRPGMFPWQMRPELNVASFAKGAAIGVAHMATGLQLYSGPLKYTPMATSPAPPPPPLEMGARCTLAHLILLVYCVAAKITCFMK